MSSAPKKRPALQVMAKPTTEVKSIQRCFETVPSPQTTQQIAASENISHLLQQDLTSRQFELELQFPQVKRENIIVTLIRSLRTILIAATEPNLSILRRIEFPPQVKYDTVKVNMSLDGQLTISAKESLGHLPPPVVEIPHLQSTSTGGNMKPSSPSLPTDNSFVLDQSKNLDCDLISQGATPADAQELTHELITTVSEDGKIWTFQLPIPKGFAPGEMSCQVTPETNTVVIVGKRWGIGKEPGKKKWLEFWRKFELPENVKPESIVMSFSQDGKELIVSAEMDDSRQKAGKEEKKGTNPTGTKADKLNPFTRMLN